MVRRLAFAVSPAMMVLMLAWGSTAYSMPMFARKLGVDCTMCHNPYPKLNRVGYDYRAAGFRMPSEIGKEEEEKAPLNIGDYLSARLKTDVAWTRTKNKETGVSTSKTDFQFKEVTIYPITGEFLGNWASEVEISLPVGEEESVETENAYVKYAVAGRKEGRFFTVRTGVFHPFEGYGAADRPIGLSRPLFETSKASGSPFKIWGLDQTGLELGYSMKDTRVTAAIFNGVNAEGEANQASDSDNSKDIEILVNRFIGAKGAAASVYYYKGKAEVETGGRDSFRRWAIFANAPLANDRWELLGGYSTGKDSLPTAGVRNKGHFAEVRAPLDKARNLYGTLRYDLFDPSTGAAHNSAKALTLGANWRMAEWVQLLAEIRHKGSEQGPGTGNKDEDSVRTELVVIF